ncbi:MAG TPA: hypothetical protein VFT45_27965 [Longimicrobium sp.]|nr:hypothetical protein [Longimicrobium sp.]
MRIAILPASILCAGCWLAGPPPAPSPPVAPAASQRVIDEPRACVVLDGELKIVVVQWDMRAERLTYRGLPLDQAFPVTADYAAAHDWYPRDDSISFGGRTFHRYGAAREMSYVGLARVGEYGGVGVYANPTEPYFILLPVRPLCVFQVYESLGPPSDPPPAPGSAAPAPSPLPTPEQPAVTMSDSPIRPLTACVVRNGELAEVEFEYNLLTGDSVYQGVPFSRAFPLENGYAGAARWYVDNLAIAYQPGPRFIKYGLPRPLRPDQITRIGEYDGVGVYGEAGWTDFHDVIYLPVRPGCWFQPYVVLAKM